PSSSSSSSSSSGRYKKSSGENIPTPQQTTTTKSPGRRSSQDKGSTGQQDEIAKSMILARIESMLNSEIIGPKLAHLQHPGEKASVQELKMFEEKIKSTLHADLKRAMVNHLFENGLKAAE